jgi:hypothetical protein
LRYKSLNLLVIVCGNLGCVAVSIVDYVTPIMNTITIVHKRFP